MRTVLVRYKTAAAHADANEALVRAVFEELRIEKPRGLRYSSYRFPDGTFVHVATHTATGENPLTSLPAFKAFQANLKDRCVEPPVVTEVSPVGMYVAAELTGAGGQP
jgi:hypothetical protein